MSLRILGMIFVLFVLGFWWGTRGGKRLWTKPIFAVFDLMASASMLFGAFAMIYVTWEMAANLIGNDTETSFTTVGLAALATTGICAAIGFLSAWNPENRAFHGGGKVDLSVHRYVPPIDRGDRE